MNRYDILDENGQRLGFEVHALNEEDALVLAREQNIHAEKAELVSETEHMGKA